MLKKIIFSLMVVHLSIISAQVLSTNPEFEAHAIGGKEQIEQVLQTQLTLPKIVLTPNFETEIKVFFDLDSVGKAIDLKFEGGINNSLRNELKRAINFLKFHKTVHISNDIHPYFLVFKLAIDKYNRYFKQKNKLNLKKTLIADSSYVLYTKADKAPEYYKNGDEGLSEFMLTHIEYPKLAIEKSIEGTVIVEFVVETNGYITNVIAKQTINAGCTEEAIRLIKETKWQPAVLNNKYVRYKTNYPITFSLRNNNKDNTGSSPMGQ